jgi:hypothetical protein
LEEDYFDLNSHIELEDRRIKIRDEVRKELKLYENHKREIETNYSQPISQAR